MTVNLFLILAILLVLPAALGQAIRVIVSILAWLIAIAFGCSSFGVRGVRH